ncbi:phosphoglycolate phosphatase [Consotaella salsifontis]|uniref:Phosphoglycolate phosphatase n=1 Tax=Consotaella salsifontis TaxID=1365950 RepID=A0A1T4MN54_9HYPH|nr:phosphoglycolate phosphatase [Consotaella salsifontis]SJZ68489.1 phosphoglycolate phosphatase [Consotaella salsifontis]
MIASLDPPQNDKPRAREEWPRAALFDLDGTLVDSAPDLHEALNETLASYGEPPFTYEAVVKMIGAGVPKLIQRAYAGLGKTIDKATRDKVVKRFLAIYGPRATRLTTLNPGAAEATRALSQAGYRLAVVTNKNEAETETVLGHFGLGKLMDAVVGGDSGPPKKPHPGMLLLACERLGLSPEDAVFIGDGENDVEAAKAAGMPVIIVRGGYGLVPTEKLGATRVIDRLDELPAVLDEMAATRKK